VNNQGFIVTAAILNVGEFSEPNVRGYWHGTPGNMRVLARVGDAPPGTINGEYFQSFYESLGNLNNNNQFVSCALLSGESTTQYTNKGLWISGPSEARLLVRTGSDFPGSSVPTQVYSISTLNPVSISDAGSCFFSAQTYYAGTPTGLWVCNTDTSSQIALFDSPAPGAGAGVRYGTFSAPFQQASGKLVFTSGLRGAGVVTANNSAIFVGDAAGAQMALRKGSAVPGISGATISTMSYATLSDSGVIAVSGQAVGGGVVAGNSTFIVAGTPNSLVLVAREGSQAPGCPPGVVFDDLYISSPTYPSVNSQGEIAFYARVEGPGVSTSTSRGIWVGKIGGPISLLARSGDPAPGISGDVRFNDFSLPTLDSSGNVTLYARLIGLDTWDGTNQSIWHGKPGSLKLAARNGDSFLCADGVTRVSSTLGVKLPSSVEPRIQSSGVSDNGWLAYDVSFTDGREGLFRQRLRCYSDLTSDGVVDDADFSVFAVSYDVLDCADPAMPMSCEADFNADRFVDDADFVLFLSEYNQLLCD
jgi:hypothetical protein